MRIIAGKFKAKNINTPKDRDIRPTSDRARESVFNVVIHRYSEFLTGLNNGFLSDLTIADVFAGTGALGLEAMSRGGKKVVFVEKERKSIEVLNSNLKAFNLSSQAQVICCDATSLPAIRDKIDLVFLDPPYNKELVAPCLESLKNMNWLADRALIVVETEKHENISFDESFYELDDERNYGKAKVRFLIRQKS